MSQDRRFKPGKGGSWRFLDVSTTLTVAVLMKYSQYMLSDKPYCVSDSEASS